jgi:hypothetical protein
MTEKAILARFQACYRWQEYCRMSLSLYGFRRTHTAMAMDWDLFTNSLDILVTAGYCIDAPVELEISP